MSDDEIHIDVFGHAFASVGIDRETWEKKDREEKRKWALTQLQKHGEVSAIAAVEVEHGEEELEW